MISILQFQTFIEKQVMQEENSPPIPIQDMYNIKNRNYQWQSFKYQIPRSYHQNQPIRQTLQNKPKHKTNYIDSAISIKKFVPAPNTYEPKIQSRPVSGKMDKNPRKTIAQTIINQAKRQKTPGPATYFARPKTAAARINKNTPEYREHYLYQVQYLSSECPGVGEYNVNYFKRKHVISPKFHRQISVSKSSSFLLDKQHQTKELKKKLSPTLVMGTFDWLASQKKKQNKNLFGKSSRFTQGSKFDRKPGPNSYKLNLKWNDSKNILLKTCSTVANLKSVYYN